jgi:hypothetical protein
MDCFLTNSKKRKVEITNNEKSKVYETEKRKPVFILSRTTTYPWLQNGISGLTCTVCTKLSVQENFSIIWAKSCNLRTSDPIFREKCWLKKRHLYTEQSFMITFIDLILIIIFIPDFII